jgi:hypothetical protein
MKFFEKKFAKNLYPIFSSIELEFNSIWIQLNLNSINYIIFTNLNSIQVACKGYPIFSFEWNLIFTKWIQFFHKMIFICHVQQHEAQVTYLPTRLKVT